MKINLQGQLGIAAKTSMITHDVPEGCQIGDVITAIARELPEEARKLILHPDGSLRSSLFIALDDTQYRDTTATIPENTQTITLIPPMAGG